MEFFHLPESEQLELLARDRYRQDCIHAIMDSMVYTDDQGQLINKDMTGYINLFMETL